MKKIGTVLVLVLLCTLALTVSVGAQVCVGTTSINNTTDTKSGDGWSYENGVLILDGYNSGVYSTQNDFNNKSQKMGIYANENLTIVLRNTNTIYDENIDFCIFVDGILTIQSETINGVKGTLTLGSDKNDAIHAQHVVLDNADITTSSHKSGICGLQSVTLQNNAKLTVTYAGNNGIYSSNLITINDSTVTVEIARINGLYSQGNVNINGSKISTIRFIQKDGIYADGKITIDKSAQRNSEIYIKRALQSGLCGMQGISISNCTLKLGYNDTAYVDESAKFQIDQNGLYASSDNAEISLTDSIVYMDNVGMYGIYNNSKNGNISITDSALFINNTTNGAFNIAPSVDGSTNNDYASTSPILTDEFPFSVTLYLNEDELSQALTSYPYGTGASLPTITREGYTFQGWYTDESYTGNPVTEISATDIGDKAFYAKWVSTNTKLASVTVGEVACDIDNGYIIAALPTGATFPPTADQISIKPEDSNAKVTNLAAKDNGETWTFTVIAEDQVTINNYTIKIIDLAAGSKYNIAIAKYKINAHVWTVRQALANQESEVLAWIEEQLHTLPLVGVRCTAAVNTYTAAISGKFGAPNGENGTFSFTVTLSSGENDTYVEDQITLYTGIITATPLEKAYNSWYNSLAMLFSQQYPVTVTSTDGGSVTNRGTTNVFYDRNLTCQITPDDGFEIASVLVDGEEIGSVEAYTFKRVKGAHTMHVVFQPAEKAAEQE